VYLKIEDLSSEFGFCSADHEIPCFYSAGSFITVITKPRYQAIILTRKPYPQPVYRKIDLISTSLIRFGLSRAVVPLAAIIFCLHMRAIFPAQQILNLFALVVVGLKILVV
jgi:hypothetical protein